MPVVNHKLNRPGGTAMADEIIHIRLLASSAGEGEGFVATTQTGILSEYKLRTDSTGTWTITLTANTLITPANTTYQVIQPGINGAKVTETFIVPNGGGPYWLGDILAAPFEDLPGYALDVHNDSETAHAGEFERASDVVTTTAAVTAVVGQVVLGDATGGGFTVTLPAAPLEGDKVTVKKVDASANIVTVVATGKTIDGDSSATIISRYAGATFIYDGTNWSVFSPTSAGIPAASPSLVSIPFWATPTANPNNNTAASLNTAYPTGGRRISSGASGISVTYNVGLAAGTYGLVLLAETRADAGIVTVKVDGATVGTIDLYNASSVNAIKTLAGIVITEDRMAALMLEVTTKNASSSAFYLVMYGLSMTRTGA